MSHAEPRRGRGPPRGPRQDDLGPEPEIGACIELRSYYYTAVRYPAGHKERTRARIVEAAARTFRRKGFAGAGIDEVMRTAGLTAGGFYAHFKSKDELFAAVLEQSLVAAGRRLEAGLEGCAGDELLGQVVARYLSGVHRAGVEAGCPLPSLAAEVARAGRKTRQTFERALFTRLADLYERLPADEGMDARSCAVARLATMVGGMLLSRAVADESAAEGILAACRRFLLEARHGPGRGASP